MAAVGRQKSGLSADESPGRYTTRQIRNELHALAAMVSICLLFLVQVVPGSAQTAADATSHLDSLSQHDNPENYGAAPSQCEQLPDWKPAKRFLLIAAREDGSEAARFHAFMEALVSYFLADVRIVTPPDFRSELLVGIDGIVFYGNGAFVDKDSVREAIAAANATVTPIAWIGHGAEDFPDELGLRFLSADAAPNVGQVPEIEYNGVIMPTGDLAFATLLAPKTERARHTLGTARLPGVERFPVIISDPAGLAYVGYLPFYGNNSSLPFVAAIDAISRLFGRREPDRRVLFRLEDISAMTYGADDTVFAKVTDFLLERKVFMHLGIIAEDVDLDPELEEERFSLDIGAARNVVRLVSENPNAVEIVQHGYRHYRKDSRNAECATPGCGFEFFADDDEIMGREAAANFARERLLAGREVLTRHLRAPMVFEAPHYLMSPAQTAVAEDLYPMILHAPWIYNGESGDFFLPWFTRRANVYYGPSDVGYVAYDDPTSVEKILANLDHLARILPDPVVTVFFHPFMRNADGREDDLEWLVTGIESLGYRFASACDELASRN